MGGERFGVIVFLYSWVSRIYLPLLVIRKVSRFMLVLLALILVGTPHAVMSVSCGLVTFALAILLT